MAWVWGCAGRRDRPCNSEGGAQPEKEILGCGGGLVGGGGLVHGSWCSENLFKIMEDFLRGLTFIGKLSGQSIQMAGRWNPEQVSVQDTKEGTSRIFKIFWMFGRVFKRKTGSSCRNRMTVVLVRQQPASRGVGVWCWLQDRHIRY